MNKTSIVRAQNSTTYRAAPTPMRKGTARLTLLMVLGSETVFFGMLIAAYLYLRASQATSTFIHTPVDQLGGPILNTLILLASAGAATLAGWSIRRGKKDALVGWLGVTVVLGLIFIGGQVLEYLHSGMTPADQSYGGVFFTLMGFHALHMLAGSVVVALALVRARLGDFTARRHTAVDVSIGFWYYVVVVWLVLFTVLYLV
ncbi:MAG TPA: cytochrome c oxidase subunit 3 [Anaerolineaceae bacterium]|jgi:cytochrome c oxidase subunit 3